MACSGLSSVGFPTEFQGLLPHLTQRTSITTASHFPLRGRPFGHREASLLICNFSRVAQATPDCKQSADYTVVAVLQLDENSNTYPQLQAHAPVESPRFCGKLPLVPRNRAQIRQPVREVSHR